MIRKFIFLFLTASSFAFGEKGDNEEEMIRLLAQISDLIELLNTQVGHQIRLQQETKMIFELLLEVNKPYDYDWYKEPMPGEKVQM
jgi:hypothetical protein